MKILKDYYKPTPKKWRRIGDAMLACAGIIGGGGLLAFDELDRRVERLESQIWN